MQNKTWYQSIWYWRLAGFECVAASLIAGATCWIASVANTDWSNLNKTAKITIILCVNINMLKVIQAFFSTTIQTLKDNQPIPDGTSVQQQTVVKQVVTSDVADAAPALVNPQPKKI